MFQNLRCTTNLLNFDQFAELGQTNTFTRSSNI